VQPGVTGRVCVRLYDIKPGKEPLGQSGIPHVIKHVSSVSSLFHHAVRAQSCEVLRGAGVRNTKDLSQRCHIEFITAKFFNDSKPVRMRQHRKNL
jgi:hypothetical protein